VLSIRIDNGALLAGKVRVISSFWQRHWPGNRQPLSPDLGLLLNPGGNVHSFGMPCVLDVVFLDRHWRVLKVIGWLEPARWAWAPRTTQLALLLAGGRCCSSGLYAGMSLSQDSAAAHVAQPFATTLLRRSDGD
jgi:uncharacterized protein